MLKQKLNQLLRRSHFWRDTGFDELSELYISNLLRGTALTVIAVFVPFYLYQNNYSAAAIFAMYGVFFMARVIADIGAGFFVARFGPKHAMIVSCLLQIVNAALLLTVPSFHWHQALIAIPWGVSASFFFVAFHVAFSKIKHTTKAGHELGHMQAFEKAGHLLGPLLGGVIGTIFGAEYIFLAAAALLLGSLWPLFLSAEPVKTRQKLNFRDLPVVKIKDDLRAYTFLGIENSLCMNAWPFYAAVIALSGAVYAQLGVVSAVGVLAAIVTARIIGRMTDTTVARRLMHTSAVINGLTYLVRPFVQNVWGVFAVNVANEAITTGYRMPFMKGMYAAADDLPGFRIVYICSMEATASIAKATVWLFLALLAFALPLQAVLCVGFAIAGVASLGITTERFKVYNLRVRG